MKIHVIGSSRQDDRGCVQFSYRGYQISISNVFSPGEIAIFTMDGDGPIASDFTAPVTINGIVAAKEYIDNLLD